MKQTPIIMNFSGIYEEEDFYKEANPHWIDCKELLGVNGYCAEEAQEEIRKRIKEEPLETIHFIDSGNYHYVSKFWLEKLEQPCTLIVFDQHTDMQESAFFGMLSCGSWIKDVLETNPYVQQVCVLGPPEASIKACREELQEFPDLDKVTFVAGEGNLKEELQSFLEKTPELPVYLSIDKDVLCLKDARTNWDQGEMTLQEMETLIEQIFAARKVLGVDICGENPQDTAQVPTAEELEINNRTNKLLYFNKYLSRNLLKGME